MGSTRDEGVVVTMNGICINPRELSDHLAICYRRLPIDTCLVSKKFYKSPLTNYAFGVAMGGLLLKLQNCKKVKLIFGHPVYMLCIVFHCFLFKHFPDERRGNPPRNSSVGINETTKMNV